MGGARGPVGRGWGEVADTYQPAHSRFSVSNDLKYDAERDLRDINAPDIAVHALSKVGGWPFPLSPGEGWVLVTLQMCLCSLLSPDQVW